MMTFVSELEPKPLWQHFDEILTIPRGSKNEEAMRRYVIGCAEKKGLEHRQDAAGNVVVVKPGTAGHESAPITILQAHLDMVNEKNSDVDHDFDKDPIQPERDGDYLKAQGTTLGSDNGIGVASMLAILDADDLEHGPLELLFTIDEETGLTGAANLGEGMLEGRRLLNLDSEEEGVLTIGCAGGADSHLTLGLISSPTTAGSAAVSVRLTGLKGGHSGVDIHLQRGNAVKLLARALFAASLETPFRLAEFRGGDKHNAIPREAFATVVVPTGSADAEKLRATVEAELTAIGAEFASVEPGMEGVLDVAEVPSEAWDEVTSRRVLELVQALPHGVQSMSYDIPELVETSTNLAAVKPAADDALDVLLSSRSSVASALSGLRQKIRATALLAGASVAEGDGYPGWKPNLDSPLLQAVQEQHEKVLGTEPSVGAIHAGLECGIIGEKYDGMDMISFGPQIEFPHSPDERVKIPSVKDFYQLLTATLRSLA
jgi:dipeptidase D